MAWECPVFTIPGLEAGADLSTKQFYCVKQSSTVNRVSVCDTAGEPFLGILQNDPDAVGKTATVMALGVSKVSANEALAVGDFWGTSADGQAAKIEHTNTGADLRAYAAGVVLGAAAAAGELATVTVGFPTFIVSA